jgi:hypothetical protein
LGQGIIGLKPPVVVALGIHGQDPRAVMEEGDDMRVLLSMGVGGKGTGSGGGGGWGLSGHGPVLALGQIVSPRPFLFFPFLFSFIFLFSFVKFAKRLQIESNKF